MAKQIYRYLVKNDYTDPTDQIADIYHEAKASGTLAELPDELKPYADQVFQLIDNIFSDAQLPKVGDGRKPKTNPLNANFDKKEFQELWARINRKAVYRVEFDSSELVRKCVSALDRQLRVTPLQYTIQEGKQNDGLTDEQLRTGEGFTVTANPDWAISFKAGSVRHIYFVAETKGTMSSMKLREIEKTKIECARKFFDEINQRFTEDRVKYDVVTDYGKLMELVA